MTEVRQSVGGRDYGEMLNYIWAFMILLGIIYAALSGNLASVTEAAINSCGEAISLCITMAGVTALWMGLMEIADQAGVIGKLSKGLEPFLDFMFPRIPKGHPARDYISSNLIANILGLGWACTPAGLKAMEAMADLDRERGIKGIASDEMCTLLILNISSLQLIPVNMIAYRSQYGSEKPAAVIVPALIATSVSTVSAVIYCRIKAHKSESY